MKTAQIIVLTMRRLHEHGLSFDQVKMAATAIVPAVMEVDTDYEKNVNMLCECFAQELKRG